MIDFPENCGKRAAMAAGIRATEAEVIVFVDSDSVVEPGALRMLVQPLHDSRVGAVCGHADVLNVRESWLTRMQAVRYFVAFRVVKAAESVFGRSDLLLWLLLGLSPRGDHAAPRVVGGTDVSRRGVDLRR